MPILSHKYSKILVKAIQDIFKFNSNIHIRNYLDLIKYLDFQMNEIIRQALVVLFETLDTDFSGSPEQKAHYIKKGKHPRTILTIFGEITFEREYYYPKHNGDGFYYVDKELQLPRKDYYDPLIKALVIERYSEHSYGESGNIVGNLIGTRFKSLEESILSRISRQTVFNIVHSADIKPQIEEIKDEVETLYIQLDEKYIHTQGTNGKSKEVKIAVIHTGKELEYHNRYKLKNRFVIASDQTIDTIRPRMIDYIYKTYSVDKIKNVIVSGDGANWIKNCVYDFKFNNKTNVLFILDKFHTHQAINHITTNEEYKKILRSYLNNDMKSDFYILCNFLIYTQSERKDMIVEKMNYILKNWTHIQSQNHDLNVGCSVEGHVSHVLASKLTSRPKGYKLNRIHQTINIRTMKQNEIDIKEVYLRNNTDYIKPNKLTIKIVDDPQPIINLYHNKNSGLCNLIRKYL
ncbi:UPF0236 family protein [Mycoplasmatota bacterium WC44]